LAGRGKRHPRGCVGGNSDCSGAAEACRRTSGRPWSRSHTGELRLSGNKTCRKSLVYPFPASLLFWFRLARVTTGTCRDCIPGLCEQGFTNVPGSSRSTGNKLSGRIRVLTCVRQIVELDTEFLFCLFSFISILLLRSRVKQKSFKSYCESPCLA